MSGKDERSGAVPKCLICNVSSRYWTAACGNKSVFWLYSKKHILELPSYLKRDGMGSAVVSTRWEPLIDIINTIDNVWCGNCSRKQSDGLLVEKVIEMSLQLEIVKYGGYLHEWEG